MGSQHDRAIEAARAAGLFGSCWMLVLAVLLAPLPVGAAEITGRITVGASGAEVLPDDLISIPLEEVEVHVGVIERTGGDGIQAFYGYIGSAFTNEDGEFTIDIGPDPPPETSANLVDHVVVVILESEDKAVAIYDNQNDPTAPACVGTDVIQVSTRGTTTVDIDVMVTSDNDSEYQAREVDFRPTEDKLAMPVFGMLPRCTRDFLGMPAIPTPAYDQRGLTNTKPDRFANLAVYYVRAFDAYKFVRDGLGKGSFTPVRVNAFEDTNVNSYSYLCSTHAIQMPPEVSQFFTKDVFSRIYAMRHEYGHHFMCASPIAGSDALPARAQGDSAHGGLANSNSAGAWSEGFAAWFPATVAEYNGENRPYVQVIKGGEIDLQFGDAQLDDPHTAGEQPTHGSLGEEFAIATLLWQVSDVVGSSTVYDSLEGAPVALDNFNRVYTTLSTDGSVASFFDTLPCDFIDTNAMVFGIDCLFIDRGFYHDLDGDGRYGPDDLAGGNEIVGSTRWPLDDLPPTTFRPDTPEIEGSTLRLTVEDGAGDPVSVQAFEVEIQYDAPFEVANSEYRQATTGSSPYEIPILLPGKPSRALISPVTTGPEAAAPLIVESAFFHDSVNPFREGGVAPILAEHTFVVEVPEPGAAASVLAALAALGLLRIAKPRPSVARRNTPPGS